MTKTQAHEFLDQVRALGSASAATEAQMIEALAATGDLSTPWRRASYMATDSQDDFEMESKSAQIRTFFIENPDEFLSEVDMARKFDLPYPRRQIRTLCAIGHLETKEISNQFVYVIGPNLRSN